jgi:hypothetical protein
MEPGKGNSLNPNPSANFAGFQGEEHDGPTGPAGTLTKPSPCVAINPMEGTMKRVSRKHAATAAILIGVLWWQNPAWATPKGRHQPARPWVEETKASWYGGEFQGRRSADGSRFNAQHLTAAHRSLRLGSRVRVTDLRSGRSVVVRITDRGPFVRGRGIDLSYAAARRLGMVHRGVARVRVELIRPEKPAPILLSSSWEKSQPGMRAILE